MRKSGADAAAVEVDDLAILPAGEDYTPTEGVTALVIDPTHLEQLIERIALRGEMTP